MKTALGDIEIISRLGSDERTLAFDVLDGLTKPFKEIPPKHFYDTEGSRLFEAITRLPEYYPTRTERAILTADAAHLVDVTQMAELVELGYERAFTTVGVHEYGDSTYWKDPAALADEAAAELADAIFYLHIPVAREHGDLPAPD